MVVGWQIITLIVGERFRKLWVMTCDMELIHWPSVRSPVPAAARLDLLGLAPYCKGQWGPNCLKRRTTIYAYLSLLLL